MIDSLSIALLLAGAAFFFAGTIGLLRFPDVYTRLHATGKVGVFGVVFLLIAAAIWTPLGWGKALLLIVLLMISGPVSTHAISSAAYRIGAPMQNAARDDLPSMVEEN